MDISSVEYVDENQDRVIVRTASGVRLMPWPDEGDFATLINEWINAGNTIAEAVIVDPLEDAKRAACERVRASYEAELSRILSQYSETEQKTWSKQEEEARAFLADPIAGTPLLDAISSARGMAKPELVARIVALADAWILAAGAATGKRQALEEQILVATTMAEVDAIEWEC
ncbi:hypothetical protein MRB56_12590 [Halomonas cupida]|uniref:hypothetical protein n=1 Tax=Halomonas cupida TaxID=44933 RepID=UPI0039B55143